MFAWGNTVNGELGVGGVEEEHVLMPTKLKFKDARNVVYIACGENHSVMVLKDGSVYTCGNNDVHQLGHDKNTRKRPEMVDALSAYKITLAACGSKHTLVTNEWGQVYSWGSDISGQLGHGLSQEFLPFPKIIKHLATKQVVQIACGAHHSVALINNGDLYAWGQNQYGQLGLGFKSNQEPIPTVISSLEGIPIAQISCGSHHTFVLSKSGAVFCWGKNSFGQLGLNDETHREFPAQLRALRHQKIMYVSCGEDHTAVLTRDGGVFTFGAGMYGQLGHNSHGNEILPRKVTELMGSTVTQIACGRRHTLVYVPTRGRMYSFGLGGSGQLGINSTRNCKSPMVVFGRWASPAASQHMLIDGEEEHNSYVVYRIFTGGDHCFALVTDLKDEILPDDYRIHRPEMQILTLTEEMANDCVQMSSYGGEKSLELMSYIENVFASSACINASFLLSNDQHFGCSRNNHGVDFVKVEKFFSLLRQAQNEVIIDLIENCEGKELIAKLTNSPPDVEALRIYIVLPESHFFNEADLVNTIICPFGYKLLSLKNEALKILEHWWRNMHVTNFVNLITIYKQCIIYILDLPKSESAQENILRKRGLDVSMRLLEKLNRVNNAGELLVPYESFYISAITEKIDVRLDYVKWLHYGKLKESEQIYFCNYPFLFDARAKTLLLQMDTDLQMQHAVDDAYRRIFTSMFMPVDPTNPFLILYVSRDNIVQDTVIQLGKHSGNDFKKPLKVIFYGEDAVDAGGVRKEFFLLILKEIVDPKYGMFKEYETRHIWFNDQSFEEDIMYHLIGTLCGLAIYNGNIIDLPFPLALYKKLLQETVKIDDLKDLAPSLVKGLRDLLAYNDGDVQDTFMLNFEITRESFGETITTELKPGGSQISVNNENRHEYVDLYVDFILNKSVETQFNQFYTGFHKVCGGQVLELFHAHELMAMVIGNENYNWKELEESTSYKGEYHPDHPTIKLFWKVFHELSLEDKKKFLSFLTGSDRIPILGMKSIQIYIQSTGGSEEYLPVAHTCFNLLDLPQYKSESQLHSKLLQAIEHTQGFTLA